MENKVIGIVAVDEKFNIGTEDGLPWRYPEDLSHFKGVTENNIVVMGSNTFKTLGYKPLPNRFNVVLTRDVDYYREQYLNENLIFINIENGVKYITNVIKPANQNVKIFIIGGKRIYTLFEEIIDVWLVTRIQRTYNLATVQYRPSPYRRSTKVWEKVKEPNIFDNIDLCLDTYIRKI